MAEKVLGNVSRGRMFVISAPAGTGKTTLVRMLTKEHDCIVESVSYTTRSIRPGEEEGRDYYFVSPEIFQQMIAKDEFLEYAEVFGYFYGTNKIIVEETLARGKHVVLVIDTQGATKLKELKIDAVYVFIAPPTFKDLEERLLKRQTEDERSIRTRLSWAQKEMETVFLYDYVIVNRNIDVAYQVLKSIFIAEEHRIAK